MNLAQWCYKWVGWDWICIIGRHSCTQNKIFQNFRKDKENLYNISNSFVQVQVPSLIFYCQHWANPCIYDFLFTALLSAPALVVLLDFSNPLTGELSTRALALGYLANWPPNPLLLSRMSATFDRHLEAGWHVGPLWHSLIWCRWWS